MRPRTGLVWAPLSWEEAGNGPPRGCSALTLPVHPQPLHVVCPEQYTQPPPTQSHRTDLMIDCQPPPVSYRRAEVLTLPFKRRYEKIEIMPEVSSGFPRESPGEDHGLLLGCVRYG